MAGLLWDMHVHLDFMREPERIAQEAAAQGLGMFAVTVTPDGHERLRGLRNASNVRIGVGLHPWWAADGRCDRRDAERAAVLVRETRFVGEIGLDASEKHVPDGSLPLQSDVFALICAACAASSQESGPRILSIHSVKSAGLTLDILERSGCLETCRCIFHWFTGSNEELTRAVRSGCMFSINEMMLRTRRGREYARQIPADRLLLETDLPPGEDVDFSAAAVRDALESALRELSALRGADMREKVIANSARLLDL